jgi:hypothetical protein
MRAAMGDGGDEAFAELADALAWLKTERSNLTAAIVAASTDHPRLAIDLSYRLMHILIDWRFFEEGAEISHAALESARALGGSA